MKRTFSVLILTLLLTSMLAAATNIRMVKASGTIYIRADGSVDPPDAPISTADNVTYTMTGNITLEFGSTGIVIERDNIVLDGSGFTVSADYAYGIFADRRKNLTIENTRITGGYALGISLGNTNESVVIDNIVESNGHFAICVEGSANVLARNTFHTYGISASGGMMLGGSMNTVCNNDINGGSLSNGLIVAGSSNSISGNTIGCGEGSAVVISGKNNSLQQNSILGHHNGVDLLSSSSNNSLLGNVISTARYSAINTYSSNNNCIVGNDITGGDSMGTPAIFFSNSSQNMIFHNNIVGRPTCVSALSNANAWDDGYPSGGNYWSDHSGEDLYKGRFQNESGSDGIGDVPYLISANNRDNYPFMEPLARPPDPFVFDIAITNVMPSKTVIACGQPLSLNVTVKNTGSSESPMTFNLTVEVAFKGDTYTPSQRDFKLQASATQGWNYSIPGPPIGVFLGDNVSMTIEGVDNLHHKFYVDYNGNEFPDRGEPQSTPFINTTITYQFTANTLGNFTYYCAYHQNTMKGTFTVNPWPPAPILHASQNVTLNYREEKSIIFVWNTTGWLKGNYTISACATPVPGETHTADNTFAGGTVIVTILGDVDGDFDVDILDVVRITSCYSKRLDDPVYNPNADIDGNGVINIFDVVLCTGHYGQKWP